MFYDIGDAGRVPRGAVQVALNRVKGMPFDWSLNPYMGCVHRCTFCYVRAFERRADRPVRRPLRHVDPGEGRTSPRCCAASSRRRSWDGEPIAIGAATDPYQPAEGRYRLTRALPRGAARRGQPVLDHHARPADRARRRAARRGLAPRRRLGHVLGADARRRRLAHDRARHGAAAAAAARADGARRGTACGPRSAWRRSSPASRTTRSRLERVVVAAREAGACGIWANLLYLKPGTREHFLAASQRDWPELLPEYERLYATVARTSLRRTPSRRGRASSSRSSRGSTGSGDRPAPSGAARLGDAAHDNSSLLSDQLGCAVHGRRDHDADRRRPRGRPRRAAAVALARAAHPRDRRGRRRRLGGRARRAAQARRDHHGRSDAGHGRARGDEAPDRAGARVEGADLHGLLGAVAPRPRARVGREGLHPQGGAAPDARARDREGRPGRGLRRSGADARVPRRQGPDRHADRRASARSSSSSPTACRTPTSRGASSSRRRPSRATSATSSRSSRPTRARTRSRSRFARRSSTRRWPGDATKHASTG